MYVPVSDYQVPTVCHYTTQFEVVLIVEWNPSLISYPSPGCCLTYFFHPLVCETLVGNLHIVCLPYTACTHLTSISLPSGSPFKNHPPPRWKPPQPVASAGQILWVTPRRLYYLSLYIVLAKPDNIYCFIVFTMEQYICIICNKEKRDFILKTLQAHTKRSRPLNVRGEWRVCPARGPLAYEPVVHRPTFPILAKWSSL